MLGMRAMNALTHWPTRVWMNYWRVVRVYVARLDLISPAGKIRQR
jgi:hypothetical protein